MLAPVGLILAVGKVELTGVHQLQCAKALKGLHALKYV